MWGVFYIILIIADFPEILWYDFEAISPTPSVEDQLGTAVAQLILTHLLRHQHECLDEEQQRRTDNEVFFQTQHSKQVGEIKDNYTIYCSIHYEIFTTLQCG